MIQGSQEWHESRIGMVTASRISDVVAGGRGATRAAYMNEIITTMLTGVQDDYTNPYMEWGIEHEPKARQLYELLHGVEVEEVGFIKHPSIERTGASPDGLVGDDGMVEIKCPASKTHSQFLIDQKINRKYQLQMLWQMECTGRKWCDFVSYDPRFPAELQLSVKRVEFDEVEALQTREKVVSFVEEMEKLLAQIEQIREKANASNK